jgi:hypothetical protein
VNISVRLFFFVDSSFDEELMMQTFHDSAHLNQLFACLLLLSGLLVLALKTSLLLSTKNLSSCLFASFFKRTIQKRQNYPWICLWCLEALFASSENPYTCQWTNSCSIPTVLSCRKPTMTKIGDTCQSFSVQHLSQSIDIKQSKSRHIQNCAVVDDDRPLSNFRHVMT